MSIDWAAFTPWSAAIGGIIIGAAAVLLMAFNGRIAGISGIVGRILPWNPEETPWRSAFVLGLLLAPFVWRLFAPFPEMHIEATNIQVILAGLLVGFGARLGSGCTSGHGVCGLSRLSIRSLAATVTFIGAGVVSVYLTHHIF
jgi:uncharacterized protein